MSCGHSKKQRTSIEGLCFLSVRLILEPFKLNNKIRIQIQLKSNFFHIKLRQKRPVFKKSDSKKQVICVIQLNLHIAPAQSRVVLKNGHLGTIGK